MTGTSAPTFPNTHSSTVDTPFGPFTMIVDEDAVLASGWTANIEDLLPLIRTAATAAGGRVSTASRPPATPAARLPLPLPRPELGRFTKAVLAYHDGDLAAVDDIPVRQAGGVFLTRAWEELRALPPGAPVTYAELAARAGRPAAVRAAAQACARNAAALFVPCHRVVRTDGGLGGFRWGIQIKSVLLAHEARR